MTRPRVFGCIAVLLGIVAMGSGAQATGNSIVSPKFVSLSLVPMTSDNLLGSVPSGSASGSAPLYAGLSAHIDSNYLNSGHIELPLGPLTIFGGVKGDVLYDFFLANHFSYYDADVGGSLLLVLFPAGKIPINGSLDVSYRGKNKSPLNPSDTATSLFKIDSALDLLFDPTAESSSFDVQIVPYAHYYYSSDNVNQPDTVAEFNLTTRFLHVVPTGATNPLWGSISLGFRYDNTSFYAHEAKLLVPFGLTIGRATVEWLNGHNVDMGSAGIEIGITYQTSPVAGIDKVIIAYNTGL